MQGLMVIVVDLSEVYFYIVGLRKVVYYPTVILSVKASHVGLCQPPYSFAAYLASSRLYLFT